MGDYVSDTLLAKDADGTTCGQRLADMEADMMNTVPSEELKSRACSAVSIDYEVCGGCQGYSIVVRYYISLQYIQCEDQIPLCHDLTWCCRPCRLQGSELIITGCVGVSIPQCQELARAIVQENPDLFKDSNLVYEEHDIAESTYNKLGLPVFEDNTAPDGFGAVTGVAGDCKFVHIMRAWQLI